MMKSLFYAFYRWGNLRSDSFDGQPKVKYTESPGAVIGILFNTKDLYIMYHMVSQINFNVLKWQCYLSI